MPKYEGAVEPSKPLPKGWVAFKDESGDEYYFHPESNQTVWDHPDGSSNEIKDDKNISSNKRQESTDSGGFFSRIRSRFSSTDEQSIIDQTENKKNEKNENNKSDNITETDKPNSIITENAAETNSNEDLSASAESSTMTDTMNNNQNEDENLIPSPPEGPPPPPVSSVPVTNSVTKLFSSSTSTATNTNKYNFNQQIKDERPLPKEWKRYESKSVSHGFGQDYYYHIPSTYVCWDHPSDHGTLTRSKIWFMEMDINSKKAKAEKEKNDKEKATASKKEEQDNKENDNKQEKESEEENKKDEEPIETYEELILIRDELLKNAEKGKEMNERMNIEIDKRNDKILTLKKSIDEQNKLSTIESDKILKYNEKLSKLKAELKALEPDSELNGSNNDPTDRPKDANDNGVEDGQIGGGDKESAQWAALTAASAILQQGEIKAKQLSTVKEILVKEEQIHTYRMEQAEQAEASMKEAEMLLKRVSSHFKTKKFNNNNNHNYNNEEEKEEVDKIEDDGDDDDDDVIEEEVMNQNTKLVKGGITFDLCLEVATSPWAYHVLNRVTVICEVWEWQAWSPLFLWSATPDYLPSKVKLLLENAAKSAGSGGGAAALRALASVAANKALLTSASASTSSATYTSVFSDMKVQTLLDAALEDGELIGDPIPLPGDCWEWVDDWRIMTGYEPNRAVTVTSSSSPNPYTSAVSSSTSSSSTSKHTNRLLNEEIKQCEQSDSDYETSNSFDQSSLAEMGHNQLHVNDKKGMRRKSKVGDIDTSLHEHTKQRRSRTFHSYEYLDESGHGTTPTTNNIGGSGGNDDDDDGCDEDGWRYGRTISDLLKNSNDSDDSDSENNNDDDEEHGEEVNRRGSSYAGGGKDFEAPDFKIRKRRWRRTRVVNTIPGISGSSYHFLHLLSRISSLELSAENLSTQLVATQLSQMKAQALQHQTSSALSGQADKHDSASDANLPEKMEKVRKDLETSKKKIAEVELSLKKFMESKQKQEVQEQSSPQPLIEKSGSVVVSAGTGGNGDSQSLKAPPPPPPKKHQGIATAASSSTTSSLTAAAVPSQITNNKNDNDKEEIVGLSTTVPSPRFVSVDEYGDL